MDDILLERSTWSVPASVVILLLFAVTGCVEPPTPPAATPDDSSTEGMLDMPPDLASDLATPDIGDDGAEMPPGNDLCSQVICDGDGVAGLCDPETGMCVSCLDDTNCEGALVCAADRTCVECERSQDCAQGVCDLNTRTCVACLEDEDCGSGAAVCDGTSKTCVGCTMDTDCPSGLVCADGDQTCVACQEDRDCDTQDAPVCDTTQRTCVGCLNDTTCDPDAPVCDPASKTCVACLMDSDCSNGRVCKMDDNSCVECLDLNQCDDPGAAACNQATNSCEACAVDGDCANVLGLPRCVSGTCLECVVASEDTDCNTTACLPDGTCGTIDRDSLDDCMPCQADGECRDVSRCVPIDANDPSSPTFCFTGLEFAGGMCPPLFQNSGPGTSVNGISTSYCRIDTAVTDCQAVRHYIDGITCEGASGMPDPSQCMGVGSYCVDVDNTPGLQTFECVIACQDRDACKSGEACSNGTAGNSNPPASTVCLPE